MPPSLKRTGGAGIGWVNASWPLATLHATQDRLNISALLLGSYEFSPSDVVALERYGFIPILARGVRIVHLKRNYPASIIFWTFGNPEKLIRKVRDTRFVPCGVASTFARPSGMRYF